MISRVLRLKHSGIAPCLELQQAPIETPEKSQVRVRITSAGLNRADLLFQQERYFEKPRPGSRIGFEGAGIVDAAGPLSPFKTGDRVALCPMTIDVFKQGCLADYALFESNQLIPSPHCVPDKHAGAVWMSYLTAWGGLIDAGQLQPKDTVLISAASSSVGIAAIQTAKALGAQIIATTTSTEKAVLLEDQGADHVLVQPREEDAFDAFSEQLEAIAPQGLDLSFDAVAGPASRVLIKNAKRGGRIVIHGLLDRRPMNVHAGVLMKRLLKLSGYTLDATLTSPNLKNAAINHISQQLQSRAYTPLIAATFALEDFEDAFNTLAANRHIGKIVVTP